jgi:hypothetical protein
MVHIVFVFELHLIHSDHQAFAEAGEQRRLENRTNSCMKPCLRSFRVTDKCKTQMYPACSALFLCLP